jgi:hypothetical protein
MMTGFKLTSRSISPENVDLEFDAIGSFECDGFHVVIGLLLQLV